jgi:hypothetical protein
MSDLFLSTKQSTTNQPPVPTNSPFYFGEMSNDLQVNPVGDLYTVSGSDKLVQDIQKILLTQQGTNTSLPIYGTNLQSYVGQKINDQSVVANIRTEVINALNTLNFIRQGSDPSEIPDTLNYLAVTQPDQKTININLIVTSAAGSQVTTNVIISPNF